MVPIIKEGLSLTKMWIDVLEHIINCKGKEINPLLITITDFSEDKQVRQVIDDHLAGSGYPSIQTVSETIFPKSLYKVCKGDRHALYKQYMHQYPRIRVLNRGNRKGTYFQRLIAYNCEGKPLNQLENVVESILNPLNNRRSKLQASIFDPQLDHTEGVYQSFPCLQHVTFYKSEKNGLVLNAFYAVQFFYRRAYGNWLGLIELGKFVAENTNLKLERMTCYIGVEQLDKISKGEAKRLLNDITRIQTP